MWLVAFSEAWLHTVFYILSVWQSFRAVQKELWLLSKERPVLHYNDAIFLELYIFDTNISSSAGNLCGVCLAKLYSKAESF